MRGAGEGEVKPVEEIERHFFGMDGAFVTWPHSVLSATTPLFQGREIYQRLPRRTCQDGGAMRGQIHIMPVDDLIEHEESTECQCGPTVDPETGVVLHDAMDRRECFEEEGAA